MTSEALPSSSERHNSLDGTAGYGAVLALSLTAAIVAFVGAIVVLTIPFAVLSVSLPPTVNHLGFNPETTRRLFFGRPWYLLAPATLIALWVGYSSYRWCRSTISARPGRADADPGQ